MYSYSTEEKLAAKNALPAPLIAFADSAYLKKIYSEIENIFKLNLGQLGALIEAVELTLIGLEPESAFPINVRGALRDVPDQTSGEIVEYVNEHIFAEAKNRLHGGSGKE